MQLNQINDMEDYLKDSEILDYQNIRIQENALELSQDSKNQFETIKNVYEFVRDEIPHSLDIMSQKVAFRHLKFWIMVMIFVLQSPTCWLQYLDF